MINSDDLFDIICTEAIEDVECSAPLCVFRFEDAYEEYRSHVVARSRVGAIAIFDRVMGAEYRDDDCVMEVFPIDGSTVLPISPDGMLTFVEKTADEWIEADQRERFL